jgi:uncharacterized protein
MSQNTRRLSLTTFFALAYGWTWLCWWSVVVSSKTRLLLPVFADTLSTVGQFGPFVAALLVTSLSQGRDGFTGFVDRFLRWRARPVWLAVAFFLLPATMLVAIYLYAYVHGSTDGLNFRGERLTLPLHFFYLMVLGGPLGEEPGWRGFALPRLQAAYGPVAGSVVLGLLHAGWHYPLWWMGLAPSPFWMFATGTILLSFLFTWLFNHTRGSVLYSLIFHTSLSISSVRFPEVPAYHLWLIVLLVIVVAVFFFDPRLGQLQHAAAGDHVQVEPANEIFPRL